MKRALLLLLTMPLVAVAFTAAPAEARSCSLTCSQELGVCETRCQDNLCTGQVFTCNTSDPCDSVCRCTGCAG
jgi:hypothetical protein